jgi:hypothetical protein
MSAHDGVRLVDVDPQLSAEITRLVAAADPDHPLLATIDELPYYGRCPCTDTCRNQLTAPPGSGGTWLVELEQDDEVIIWLSLDPTASMITAIEILDGRDLPTP